jgi:hypothetical protein
MGISGKDKFHHIILSLMLHLPVVVRRPRGGRALTAVGRDMRAGAGERAWRARPASAVGRDRRGAAR